MSWQSPRHPHDETILPTRDDQQVIAIESLQGLPHHKARIEPKKFGYQRTIHAGNIVKFRHGSGISDGTRDQ
jgi:hypothetical protein